MNRSDVAEEVVHFLERGSFQSDSASGIAPDSLD
jgi:hypothetical protein